MWRLRAQAVLRQIGNALFEPAPDVPAPDRRSSRLLASLLLISLIIFGITLPLEPLPVDRARASLLFGALPLLFAYALSRRGRFLIALAIAMADFVALVTIMYFLLSGLRGFEPIRALAWLVVPVLLGSMFLSFKVSIFIVLGAMTPFFGVVPLLTREKSSDWLLALVFYVSLSCLILIWSRHRGIQERDRLVDLEHRAAQLEVAIAQRDDLLREVHHRAKNNLQVISSLLILQARRTPEVAEPLRELQSRIRSMSEVYERLYSSNQPTGIELGEYLGKLVRQVIDSHGMTGVSMATRGLDASPSVGAEIAVPLGLVVTELVTNSLKHAFAATRSGTIRLEIEAHAGKLDALLVGDDGSGMHEAPPSEEHRGMGMQIVQALAKQIDAKVEQVEGPGTLFLISFTSASKGGGGSL